MSHRLRIRPFSALATPLALAAVLGAPLAAQDDDSDFIPPTSLEEAILPGISTGAPFIPPTSLEEAIIPGVSTLTLHDRIALAQVREERGAGVLRPAQVAAYRAESAERLASSPPRTRQAAVRTAKREAIERALQGGRFDRGDVARRHLERRRAATAEPEPGHRP